MIQYLNTVLFICRTTCVRSVLAWRNYDPYEPSSVVSLTNERRFRLNLRCRFDAVAAGLVQVDLRRKRIDPKHETFDPNDVRIKRVTHLQSGKSILS